MRSPLETRLQQGATAQIPNQLPKILEIVEALENSPPDDKICVAVGKDLLESVSALKWALKWAAYNRSLILLHIQVPIRYIPSPVRNIPDNQVTSDILNAYKVDEEKKLRQCIMFYLEICSKAQVKAEALIVEKEDISKGIVEVVSERGFTKLIIGTSCAGAISKKMKMQGPGKADYVLRHAIDSCEVSIICKGKFLQLRKAAPLHNDQKPMNCRIPLSKLLGERSKEIIFKPCSIQGRVLVLYNPNVQRNDGCTPVWVEELSGPSFEVSSIEQFYSALEEKRNDANNKSVLCGNSFSIQSREGFQVSSLLKSLIRGAETRIKEYISYINNEGFLKK